MSSLHTRILVRLHNLCLWYHKSLIRIVLECVAAQWLTEPQKQHMCYMLAQPSCKDLIISVLFSQQKLVRVETLALNVLVLVLVYAYAKRKQLLGVVLAWVAITNLD